MRSRRLVITPPAQAELDDILDQLRAAEPVRGCAYVTRMVALFRNGAAAGLTGNLSHYIALAVAAISTATYLFGSTARDKAAATSDVDIFIDRAPGVPRGFIELFDMEELLEETLGTKVDLATRTSLHPALKDEIERTAIRVL